MKKNGNGASEILRAAGLRATKSRIAVLHALGKHTSPATIKELMKRLSSPRPDLVTLYRTVESFSTAGIVEKITLASNEAHYELKDAHDHHHIVCTSCEKIEDFSDDNHLKLAERALKRSSAFARLTGHSFELYGLCNSCVKTTHA